MLYCVVNYWVDDYSEGQGELNLQKTLQGSNAKTIVELFEFELNNTQHGPFTVAGFGEDIDGTQAGGDENQTFTYYFTNTKNELGNDIVWQGKTYTALPLKAEGYEQTSQGVLPRPNISVANLSGVFTAIIALLPDGLEGCKVTRTRTLLQFIDNANWKLSGGKASGSYSTNPSAEAIIVDGQLVGVQYLVQLIVSGDNPGITKDDAIVIESGDVASGTIPLGRYELWSVATQSSSYHLFFYTSSNGGTGTVSFDRGNPHGVPDSTSFFKPRDIYFLDRKSMENRDVISYEMCSAFDLAGVRLPKRQILPDDFPGVGSFNY